MTIADMDFPLVPEVGQAIQAAVARGESGYVEMAESDYAAVLSWIERRTGEKVPGNI